MRGFHFISLWNFPNPYWLTARFSLPFCTQIWASRYWEWRSWSFFRSQGLSSNRPRSPQRAVRWETLGTRLPAWQAVERKRKSKWTREGQDPLPRSSRDPPASDLFAPHALVFPLSLPFGRLLRRQTMIRTGTGDGLQKFAEQQGKKFTWVFPGGFNGGLMNFHLTDAWHLTSIIISYNRSNELRKRSGNTKLS